VGKHNDKPADREHPDAAPSDKAHPDVDKAHPDGRAELDGLGRFADPSVLILTSLAGGPKHGYALIKDVEALAGVTLGPGTLYGALSRLEERGLIEALEPEERRRPYRVTGAGAAALRAYLEHAESVTRQGLRRLQALA
jgi:DNA-binding PadR family transcriptional regulator